jgi:hypothetical protein
MSNTTQSQNNLPEHWASWARNIHSRDIKRVWDELQELLKTNSYETFRNYLYQRTPLPKFADEKILQYARAFTGDPNFNLDFTFTKAKYLVDAETENTKP